MIFSDLGTEAAAATRGFSAYRWIRQRLIGLGVPAERIAFMQDYKKAEAKQGLFNKLNNGQVDFLLGSSATMGTGVNAQRRLVALHHLDVPWLPSEIEQREGRQREGAERLVEREVTRHLANHVVGAPVNVEPLGGFLHHAGVEQTAEQAQGGEDVLILAAAGVVAGAQQVLQVLVAIAVAGKHVQQHRVRYPELGGELLRFGVDKPGVRLLRP